MKFEVINICTLEEVESGNLFIYGSTIALKSEYTRDGKPECYILGSGEFFCGGKDITDINKITVTEIELKL